MDFYRLQDVSEIEDLGLEEYFYLSGLTVIEWSGRGGDLLPADCLRLWIENPGDDSRIVKCTCSRNWEARLVGLLQGHPEFLAAGDGAAPGRS
jgi:tRNA threonylcarbamoyladenosine biosynthesis protein TsaE